MTTSIHPTAIVDPRAELGVGVTVAPYAVVEAGVTVGDNSTIGPCGRRAGPATIGGGNRCEGHCSVGTPPQAL